MDGEVLVWLMLIAGVVAGVGIVVLVWIAVRFLVLVRVPGALHCAMCRLGRPWSTGILLLGMDDLQWYRARSLRLRPRRVIARGDFSIVSHRPSNDDPSTMIITVNDDDTPLVLAMNTGSFAGLVSWIDSAPPGVGNTVY